MTPENRLELQELFREAIQVIDDRGWFQGDFAADAPETGVCMLGACNTVETGKPCGDGETGWWMYELEAALPVDPSFEGVAEWNDHPDRTVTEVKTAFRLAAWLAANNPEA